VGEDRAVGVYAAASPAELDEAGTLFRAFVGWQRDRHAGDLDLIDRYFDTAEFAAPASTASVCELTEEGTGG
jgi:hypothetical protein